MEVTTKQNPGALMGQTGGATRRKTAVFPAKGFTLPINTQVRQDAATVLSAIPVKELKT